MVVILISLTNYQELLKKKLFGKQEQQRCFLIEEKNAIASACLMHYWESNSVRKEWFSVKDLWKV